MGKYKSNSGLKEYMTKNGYPEAIINNMDDFKMALKACDEGLTVWESWGEGCNTFSCKFNVESTYKMPFEGMPDSKVVVTHNGTGKYSWVLQTPDGNAEARKLFQSLASGKQFPFLVLRKCTNFWVCQMLKHR